MTCPPPSRPMNRPPEARTRIGRLRQARASDFSSLPFSCNKYGPIDYDIQALKPCPVGRPGVSPAYPIPRDNKPEMRERLSERREIRYALYDPYPGSDVTNFPDYILRLCDRICISLSYRQMFWIQLIDKYRSKCFLHTQSDR